MSLAFNSNLRQLLHSRTVAKSHLKAFLSPRYSLRAGEPIHLIVKGNPLNRQGSSSCAKWQFVLCLVVFYAFFAVAVARAIFFGAWTVRSRHKTGLCQREYNSSGQLFFNLFRYFSSRQVFSIDDLMQKHPSINGLNF